MAYKIVQPWIRYIKILTLKANQLLLWGEFISFNMNIVNIGDPFVGRIQLELMSFLCNSNFPFDGVLVDVFSLRFFYSFNTYE